MNAPADYPLPWCEALDMPYWQINFWLITARGDWREWQHPRSMAEIILEIDALINAGEISTT